MTCRSVAGQSDTGKVVITITDANGALVSGATVKARNLTGLITREAASSPPGVYEVPTLAIGRYEISVTADGFKTVRQTISVHVNEESRVAVRLEPGEPSATVTIPSEAGQVQLTSSTLGKVVGEKLIVNLPLNGRNFYDLGLLQTGVVPQTGLPFMGNIIPTTRISAAAKSLLSLYPLPNISTASRTLNFTASPSQTTEQNQFIVRIDHSASTKSTFFGRYVYDNLIDTAPFQFGNVPAQFPGFSQDQKNKNQNLALGYTRIISSTDINDFRFGFSRTNNPTDFLPLTKPKDVGINFGVPDDVGLTDVRIAGFSGIGNSIFGPSHYVFNTFQFQDTYTRVQGSHTFKVGGEYRKHQENVQLQFAENSQFLFNGVFTGDAFADFLLGQAFYFTFGDFKRDVLHQRWSATNLFVQDDLRVTQRLTLNLGVRYEYVTPIIDESGQTATVLIRKPYSTIGQSVTNGRSNYHALQTSLTKRFSRGNTFLIGYTLSRSIDLASQYHSGSGSPIDPAIVQDANDPAADRGLSSFDMRHRFTLSGVFELPFGAGRKFLARKGVIDKFVGGWSLSPIFILSSGVPLTVRDFTDPCGVSGPFITSCRPNLLRNPLLPNNERSVNAWFDTGAFSRQAFGTFGTAGRNIIFADGAENLDLAVIKRTHFGRELRGLDVEFRAEFFNLPNHPQFGPPDLDFSSTTFGQIFTTARGATERVIQFGLKLSF